MPEAQKGDPAPTADDDRGFMDMAIEQALLGRSEGGLPIGSVIVMDGDVIGRGRNLRVQRSSPILHAEMSALEDAGRRSSSEYRRCTLYTTLSPCPMCSGAVLLYGIPRVVIGDSTTYKGSTSTLTDAGVEVVDMRCDECAAMMRRLIDSAPELWYEDIGV